MLHYIPKLKLDWEDTDTFFTDIAILADREEEIDGYSDVVPILRYIHYRKLRPMLSTTQVYADQSLRAEELIAHDQHDVKLISTWDWFFIEEEHIRLEPYYSTYLPMLFKPMMLNVINNLAYYHHVLYYNWRAYYTVKQAYLSLINSYLEHSIIQDYVHKFNLKCRNQVTPSLGGEI